MINENKTGSRFIVDLGEIKLPSLLEKRVGAEIQAAVLRALAENIGGPQQDRAPVPALPNSIWDNFPGGTIGLWIGDQDKPPFLSGSVGSEPLTVRDHTLIMKAIMENPLQMIQYLPNKSRWKTGARPSSKEVLQAALQVEQIDDYIKVRIRTVLDFLPKFEEGQAALPETIKKAVDDLRQQQANKTIEEKLSLLRDAGLRSRHRDDGLAEGMEVAARMLEDGQDSIYSPDFSFYKLLQEGQGTSRTVARDAVSDISSGDTMGATAGGAMGMGGGPAAAAAGALSGGIFGSSVAVGYHLSSWVISWFD